MHDVNSLITKNAYKNIHSTQWTTGREGTTDRDTLCSRNTMFSINFCVAVVRTSQLNGS